MSASVTVCIPAYNQPAYLAEALESLCDQGIARADYRVLVNDDASPTSLAPVVRSFAERLDIVYRREPVNIGHLANFNRAFELSTTPFVSFLSHDDVVAPGQLGRALSVMQRDPGTVLVASLALCQRYPGAVDTRQHGMFLQGSRASYSRIYEWDPVEWMALSLISTPLLLTGSIFRSDVFRKCKRWLSFPMWHDRLMLAEMGLHGVVQSLPWIGGYYRVSHQQLSGQLWQQHQGEFKAASECVLELAESANLPVVEFWVEHLCRAPHDERNVYLRLLNTALSPEQFTSIRKACEARLHIRLPLTRLERFRVPNVIATMIRDLDRALAGKVR